MSTDDVSRETGPGNTPVTPSAPEVARRVFPVDRLHLAERYAHLLATEGVVRGLIGPREAPRLWDRHLLNSAVLGEAVPEASSVCDIGSGAGLPGIVLAIARPDVRVTLVEPLLRRTTFLEEVVEELSLANVEVVRGRADALHGSSTFDVVTSRAVAPLERLLRWSMPLVAPHGAMIAMKGEAVGDEIEAAAGVLAELGAGTPEVSVLGDRVVSPPVRVVRVAWADPTRVGWATAPPSPKARKRRSRRG